MSRKWSLLVVVLAAVATIGLIQAADDEAKEKGNWSMVACIKDGQELPADQVKSVVITLTGTNYTVKVGDQVMEEGTYKVDRTKTPHWVDRTATTGEAKGKTFLGICEEKGDTMQICWGAPGGDRPTEFSSKSGSGHVLETIRRAK